MDIYEVREADERIRHEEMVEAIERLNEADEISEIKAISTSAHSGLVIGVNEHLKDGWRLHGYPICSQETHKDDVGVMWIDTVWTQFVKR